MGGTMILTPEEIAEIKKSWAARRAMEEALDAKRRIEAREADLELLRAPEDPSANGSMFQKELSAFSKSLHAVGVSFIQRAKPYDEMLGEGYPLAKFVIKDLDNSMIAGATRACAAWVYARYDRKIQLGIGDVVVDAQTYHEIEWLFKRAAQFISAKDGR
jgi:hypothetical protein